MDFSFTDEQRMISETAAAFFAEVSDSEAVRNVMVTEQGYDTDVWQRICSEMFFQAIHIPEQYGGMGLGYVELAAVVEQMGANLLCSPFYSTVCLGANALMVAGSEQQQQRFLPRIVDGATATLAFAGQGVGTVAGWDAGAVELTYESQDSERQDGGFVLNGRCCYVPYGHNAEILIVAARRPGSTGQDGISLFIVDPSLADLERHYQPTMDQTSKQAQLNFANVVVAADAVMQAEGEAGPLLNKIIALGQIGLAADQLGGAQKVLDETVAYCNERTQFNRPVGSFQSVKHKAADMMLKAEACRSAVYYAACVADLALFLQEPSPRIAEPDEELSEAASIAKGYCSDAYFFNAGTAIQLHGGVGFTWEYDIHLYFKRAQSSQLMLGNKAYHQEQIAVRLLDQPA